MSTGPVAVVTGAARGIGAAVVRRLVDDGWSVVAVDRARDDPAVPYPLASEQDLRSLAVGDSVVPVFGDVRDRDVLHSAVRQAQEEFGRVDAAVAAAAVMAGGEPVWEISDQRWDALFDIDVRGVLNLAKAAMPAMLAAPEPRDGRFVALASAAAHRGLWGLGAYCAAKHAVLGLVRGLACDLTGTGLRAVAVSPGSTRTEMLNATADLYGLDSAEDLSAHQLAQRLLDPDEVAAVVAFACSKQASAINGSVLHADGGFDQ